MKIYHTETQTDYDALMIELERQGCKWSFDRKLSEVNNWRMNEHLTCLRVYDSKVNHASLNYYKEDYPDVPIIKYKAKVDEKMRFTKENVYKALSQYRKDSNFPFNDLQDEIIKLDDTPEKVVAPKFVAEWIEWNKESGVSLQVMLKCYERFYANRNPNCQTDGEKAVQWYVDNPYKFIQAYEKGYIVEPDTVTEQRYTVVIADRYLVQLFMGRTDYRFVGFDELWTWEPNAFQLTEAEIKAIDERYIPFMIPVDEVNND